MYNMQKPMLRELSAPWYPLSYRGAESSPATAARIDPRRFLIQPGGATAVMTVDGAVAGTLVAGRRSREVIGIKPFPTLLARPERQKSPLGAPYLQRVSWPRFLPSREDRAAAPVNCPPS